MVVKEVVQVSRLEAAPGADRCGLWGSGAHTVFRALAGWGDDQ